MYLDTWCLIAFLGLPQTLASCKYLLMVIVGCLKAWLGLGKWMLMLFQISVRGNTCVLWFFPWNTFENFWPLPKGCAIIRCCQHVVLSASSCLDPAHTCNAMLLPLAFQLPFTSCLLNGWAARVCWGWLASHFLLLFKVHSQAIKQCEAVQMDHSFLFDGHALPMLSQ